MSIDGGAASSPSGDDAGEDEDARRKALAGRAAEAYHARTLRVARDQAEQAVLLAGMVRVWVCSHVRTDLEALTEDDDEVFDEDGQRVECPVDADTEACSEAVEAVAAELAAREVLAVGTARHQVLLALRSTLALPATVAVWQSGALDRSRVEAVVAETDHLPVPVSGAVEALLWDEARDAELKRSPAQELTRRQLIHRVRLLVAQVDADGLQERSRTGAGARRVEARALADGLAQLIVTGPATAIEAIRRVIWANGETSRRRARANNTAGVPSQDPCADPDTDGAKDGRGLDAHRFDALHQLLLTTPPPPFSLPDSTSSTGSGGSGERTLPGMPPAQPVSP